MVEDRGNGIPSFQETGRLSWWNRMTTGKADPEEKFRKKLQWLKWLAATIAVIFFGGFTAAQYVGAFAKDEDVEAAITEFQTDHSRDHDRLEKRVNTIEDRTLEMYGEQKAASARQRLIDTRVELLLERSMDAPHRAQERRDHESRQETLEQEIARRERMVEIVEADPLRGL